MEWNEEEARQAYEARKELESLPVYCPVSDMLMGYTVWPEDLTV